MEIPQSQLYERLGISAEDLRDFCVRQPIDELAFFGSVIRQDFHPHSSDIDIMVRLSDNHRLDLFEFVGLQQSLEELFHRKVDLVQRKSIESHHNLIRKQEILENYQIVYESQPVLSQ